MAFGSATACSPSGSRRIQRFRRAVVRERTQKKSYCSPSGPAPSAWNPKRQKRRDGLPLTWMVEELSKRGSSERCCGRVLVYCRLQRPPGRCSSTGGQRSRRASRSPTGSVWVIALAAWQAGRPELIRSPRLALVVLAHIWEGGEL